MSAQTRGREYLRLVGLGALIGIPAALLAAGFLAAVHELEHLLWSDLPSWIGVSEPPWYLVIGLPVIGACVVVLARRLLPGDGGRQPLQGFAGSTPVSYGPGVALAAIGTLSFGAALGPEGPLIALGSVAGLAIAGIAKLSERQRGVLAQAGSFSAISALFGGPIVGGLFMLEGGLAMGAALLPLLVPGFVAAAIGYVLFDGLGDWGGLKSQGLTVPGLPAYHGTRVVDLLIAIAVGVVSALLIASIRRGAGSLARRQLGMAPLLLAGGLSVGLLAQLAGWLGADSQDVLFSGQASVPALVTTGSSAIVLVLLLAKALAYAVSLGCGFRGGPVFPAIFLGIAVSTFAIDWLGVSPTLAVAVGTAAGMSATSRLLLAPIGFAALLVGHNGVDTTPAAVLAAVASWLTVTALQRRDNDDEPAPAG